VAGADRRRYDPIAPWPTFLPRLRATRTSLAGPFPLSACFAGGPPHEARHVGGLRHSGLAGRKNSDVRLVRVPGDLIQATPTTAFD